MSRELALLEKLEKDLSLKQLQIKSLLTITQAINDNVSANGLFNMYKSFLSWEMAIEKMALFIISDDGWKCTSAINYNMNDVDVFIPLLLKHKRLHTVKDEDDPLLREFDIVIPVFHKSEPIAFSLIGGIKDKNDIYNKIQFITTITNIIAVAIENKRLFKRQIEQEKYKREMELASEVQHMLIPDILPSEKHFALSKIYMPHSNVGGDYLDYIKFSDHRFAICIADISGKGVAAALLMANFQALIQNLIYQYRDLETFVFALNQSVYRITKADKFITFFIAEIDTENQIVRYINAGHYPPVMINNGSIRRLDKGSTFIGAFEKLPEIKEEIINIEGETTILSFTDGLAELQDENGEYFDDKKIELFVKENENGSPDELNEKLLKEIDRFRGGKEYSDDIAILTCKIYGSK
ncbi:MAG: SpoIIE family protein phosphatase [Bacteroidota bacterium]